MGKVRIVQRDIRVPFPDQFMETDIQFRLAVPVMPSTSAASGTDMVDGVVIRGLLMCPHDKNNWISKTRIP